MLESLTKMQTERRPEYDFLNEHPKPDTQEASRLVWWLAMLALKQLSLWREIRVGDWVIEASHILGLAKHRLGLMKAVGKVSHIHVSPSGDITYTLEGLDGKETSWGNASMIVIERNGE